MSPSKRIAKPDDAMPCTGDSTDHKVLQITFLDQCFVSMNAVSQRFSNLVELELINCTIMRGPDLTAWGEKRRLRYILCTRPETADALHEALKKMPEIHRVKRRGEIHFWIKWRKVYSFRPRK